MRTYIGKIISNGTHETDISLLEGMKTVLFIGTHGVFRSKYAEAYFNCLTEKVKVDGGKLGNDWVAKSRGTSLKQGRQARFHPIWDDKVKPKHYSQYSSKLQYLDFAEATKVIGMYEPEIKPQLFKETSPNMPHHIIGSWSPSDAIQTEYWRIPNLMGTGTCTDGAEMSDPREIISQIEYNVELLIDELTI